MEQEPIQGNILKTAAGVAGAGALLSPVGLPILSGIAGIAVVGVGLFAVGTAAKKAAEMIAGGLNQAKPPQDDDRSSFF